MKLWYYSEGEKKSGPVEQQELIQLLKSGQLKPDIFVWSEGMAEWVMARSVEALNDAAFGTPPPLPKIQPSSGNPIDESPKPAKKARPKFVAALFNDEVPLYAGLKRISILIGIPAGIFWFILFEDEGDWDVFPSVIAAVVLGFITGRIPFWATKEFKAKPRKAELKREKWMRRTSKVSWIISFLIGVIATAILIADSIGYRYGPDPLECVLVGFLWWFGSLALLKGILWVCKGFQRSDA